MLAYIFWHWPRSDVNPHEYEQRLSGFHDALAKSPPAGFLGSVVFRAGKAPWLPEGSQTYVDWYLVDGSAALDPLNDAAVTGTCRSTHDCVARDLDGASAGLYRLRFGDGELVSAGTSTWFAKPGGVSIAEFCEKLRPTVAAAEGGLWGRQMGLGSTPEFCIVSRKPAELPAALSPGRVPLEVKWSRSAR